MRQIIDVHQHIFADDLLCDSLVRTMDLFTVERALVHGMRAGYVGGLGDNEMVAKAVASHPDRLLGSCHVFPPELSKALDEIKRRRDQGFVSVKLLGPEGFSPDDEKFFPMYELIGELGMMVLLHTGTSPADTGYVSSKYGRPILVDGAICAFPAIPFVLAHMGHPWYLEALAMARGRENVHLDCSGGARWFLKDHVAGHSSYPVRYERLMWGSDCSTDLYAERVNDFETIASHFDSETAGKIWYGNSRKLLQSVA
ncbi:MAG: amidohydrolase family protein [Verrucomicrobia bacterium]|nr:amidohydrolase family protein [Verrucomicrobiota bacterium]MBU4430123.1 amidohydrolase family protein [Verrucomicrobiota bacterium]MCG2680348.1 amidohydrolase family protein [Kiritimatiellia bacterium]